MQTYPTSEYKTFEDAFEALMAEPIYRENPPESAALACAGKTMPCYVVMFNQFLLICGGNDPAGLRL